jgi:hypothetical protein
VDVVVVMNLNRDEDALISEANEETGNALAPPLLLSSETRARLLKRVHHLLLPFDTNDPVSMTLHACAAALRRGL